MITDQEKKIIWQNGLRLQRNTMDLTIERLELLPEPVVNSHTFVSHYNAFVDMYNYAMLGIVPSQGRA